MKILKGHSKMKTYLINNIAKHTRRLFLGSLLLCVFAGQALAQGNDGQFVIKKDGHYLAHVYNETTHEWELQNADAFSPNCLWYSGRNFNPEGTNHNYYFYDGTNYRFLAAPLAPNGTLSLSASLPATSILRNSDEIYYFYDWDGSGHPYDGGGVARGKKHTGMTQGNCQFDWGGNACWEVYWVEYDGSSWHLSSTHHYNVTENGGRFRAVDVVNHEMDITSVTGGSLPALAQDEIEMEFSESPLSSWTPASYSIPSEAYSFTYLPAYTEYTFEGTTHYYYDGADHNAAPAEPISGSVTAQTYEWTITGAGASHLSFSESTDLVELTGHDFTDSWVPTVYYRTVNNEGHKLATLTLTVGYGDGVAQVRTATIVVNAPCQSPRQAAAPVVNYEGVTVSWAHTADSYKVYWTTDPPTWNESNSAEVGAATSYTITSLETSTTYDYKVAAICDGEERPVPVEFVYSFTTKGQHGLLVYGAVYGGGRMANVGGNTEVAIINCDSISAVYGGNDIAGEVLGTEGSSITLGEKTGGTYASYGITSANVRIGDVYGGGNGYYAYKGTTFEAASDGYRSETVAPTDSVSLMTPSHEVGTSVWTNDGDEAVTWTFPTIVKTSITLTELTTYHVKVDSLFGGAKNAFVTHIEDYDEDDNPVYATNGSTITINDGTVFAVFGGNNIGGTQGHGKHHIEVNKTTTRLTPDIQNTASTGYGRDFGIRYLFGGGNKVYGSTTDIYVNGGQCDTIFGGGNAADVYAANVSVNCAAGASSGEYTFGNIYSQAITSYDDNAFTIGDYRWEGKGVYNIRTLFGGNNMANMAGVPNLILSSGSIGTAYGGGNKGDMLAHEEGTITFAGDDMTDVDFHYGTHVTMNSPTIVVDYLYGGCQMSNVDYSTWVDVQGGHVGTVYGGCNVSGDVGSTRVNTDAPQFIGVEPDQTPNPDYQVVYGATYVHALGGTVYKKLFAGSNGYYHCNDGIYYIEGHNYGSFGVNYVGERIPTHNETNVIISEGATVKGDVYAGGNMACVGFDNDAVGDRPFPKLVGLASVRMEGGTVEGNVYGGGNMASVNGSNEVRVAGGRIGYNAEGNPTGGALYGGNDQTGQVAAMTNRVLPAGYDLASDGLTSLEDVTTYISVTGSPLINTVYGGGNGDYTYTSDVYCDITDLPIQANTFVDIGIEDNGHIENVYGGGNNIYVKDAVTVFLNVKNLNPEEPLDHDHVGTIFGGNNKGDMAYLVPNIILLNGRVNTVYGGCNAGAMTYSGISVTQGETTYQNVGSLVRLRDTYQATEESEPVATNAMVSGYVYGGCKSNGVTNNTLVLVEGGEHPATFFGGSDVSGDVGGTSQVVVTGGSTGTVYGGGNGNYNVYNGQIFPPYCTNTDVELLGGACTGDVFGGGLAGPCGTTHVTVDGGTVTGSAFGGGDAGVSGETHVTIANGTVSGSVFGGGNEAGVLFVENESTGNSTIVMNGGSVGTGVYGGCNAEGAIDHNVQITFNGGVVGSELAPADIHGGGYGASTTVGGDVNITFGSLASGDVASEYPKLYGDLYGGSAFGSVNSSELNTTTVTILNGTVNGNVYGGGLGDISDYSKGWVNGVVHVIVGGENAGTYFGKATFNGRIIDGVNKGTSIFGGNNTNGSPQTNVYVDVYQTNHDVLNMYNYTGSDRTYAIYQVFGGGNKANYAPENNNQHSEKVTHVYIHGCQNTIEEVFGGSNAAHAISTHTVVDGGRFNYIFGGGNGIVAASNVGVYPEIHQTYSQIKGGHVGFCFGGSNRLGNCINIVQDLETEGDCGELVIDNLFNGGNNADQVGEMELNLTCADQKNYLTAYGGCRLGTVYGNITVNVTGGIIGTLYGGCQGDAGYAAHVKRYDADHYPTGHPELIGTGGNITVNVYGGAIGNLFGGCDRNGNVEGKITVKVEDRNTGCALFVGNVYGGSNATDYTPLVATGVSPQVSIIKGTIGGTFDFDGNGEDESYEGNVFGGGNEGKVTSNPKVIVGVSTNDKLVHILGDVYGGGNDGNVEGASEVIIVPDSHQLTISQNDESAPQYGSNVIRVTDGQGQPVSSGASIDEYANLKLEAIPSIYGGKFNGWTLTGTGAGVANSSLPTTFFTMGTTDASITGTFGAATTHSLTVNTPSHCSITVKDGQGNTVDLNRRISEGAVLQLEVTVETGYLLDRWTVNGGAVVTNLTSTTTSFIMGTADAVISVVLVPAHILTINTPQPQNGGSITVTDVQGQQVHSGTYIREGAVLNLAASPATGFAFGEWTVTGSGSVHESHSVSTTFTMGTANATLTPIFVNE